MSSSSLIRSDVQPSPAPSPPQPVLPLTVAAVVASVIGIALMVLAAVELRNFNHHGVVSTIIGVVLVLLTLYPLWPTLRSIGAGRERARLLQDGKLVAARRSAARGREDAQIGMGYAVASVVVALLLLMVLANSAHGNGIAHTFFSSSAWRQSFSQMLPAFWINIWVALIAQVLVLIFGLLLAVMRMLPGRAGAPLRRIAIVYCDVFRAVPAIVVIYLIVFGVPLAAPGLTKISPTLLGVLALTLTYSAYVAEVYRAGLQSIHPSQTAAARSLGLSYFQTLRTVLVPQAVRRVIPPLLNDFISLQKDTALLSIAAIGEALLTATIWQAKLFNLSPVTLAAFFFIIITIPQARFVDYLINRDASKRAGG
ncbi:amino acid ABC transporter permease [Leekyejoonella antrihumi]|uniref:Amino acid ABC transporter permease n=1 Tax=Leekyejoonella antrihumi TaxID=1660198 RepID=A0A563E489_9MICO|nr:amino acid ABC transporter permease [Leekyejoonella antrihumi]TWP37021.1 amino acid ABC transporter permease [Leekyejoonella antrihumi]